MWLATRTMGLIALLTAALAAEEFLFPSRFPAIQESMQTRLCQAAGVPYCSYGTPGYRDNDLLANSADAKISTYASAAEEPMLLIAGNTGDSDLTRSDSQADEETSVTRPREYNPVKRDSAFHSWGGKRYDNWNEALSPNNKYQNSEDPVVQFIKRGSAFSSWGGKRTEPNLQSDEYETYLPSQEELENENSLIKKSFSSWGGKRRFSTWGGKRIPNAEKPRRAFSSWGGKRAFSSWGGKRDSYANADTEEDDRSDKRSFDSWDGKRKFSSWGGKRNSQDGMEKKSFSSWGGKRQVPCTSCDNVLAPESYRSSEKGKNLSTVFLSADNNGPIPEVFQEDNKEHTYYGKDIHLLNGFQSEKYESEEPEIMQETSNSPPIIFSDSSHSMKKRDGQIADTTKHLTYPSVFIRGRFSSWGGKRGIKPLARQLSKVGSPQTLARQYRRGGEFYAWGG